jgi:hypothetical protein
LAGLPLFFGALDDVGDFDRIAGFFDAAATGPFPGVFAGAFFAAAGTDGIASASFFIAADTRPASELISSLILADLAWREASFFEIWINGLDDLAMYIPLREVYGANFKSLLLF